MVAARRSHAAELAQRDAALDAAHAATGAVALERQQLLHELARMREERIMLSPRRASCSRP
eukprot:5004106-Prymnesium_polylepis.1